MPTIVPAHQDAITHAAATLRSGKPVAFPTETVYGLGADTRNPSALQRVYAMKGRPVDNPLIAHVIDRDMARCKLTNAWDGQCDALAQAFWPGPLTMILPKKPGIPHQTTGGRDTIAIRAPRHQTAQALLHAFDGPVSAPSANRSGHISPTSAAHVAEEFATEDQLLILDGGPCEVGIESTVIDLTQHPPVVLRPGSITLTMLRTVLPTVAEHHTTTQGPSPGTQARHYAPRTRCTLLRNPPARLPTLDAETVYLLFESTARLNGISGATNVLLMPDDADACARALYGLLRQADGREASSIVIEAPATREGLWASIVDRLERACATDSFM